MPYNELIKSFEKIRAYVREFYIYGFKSRNEYDAKSARSYDDERRRIESWLGDYMRFSRTAEGKNVFISIDSRTTKTNPFYKAWKTKSFTDKDITLHFILFDILYTPEIKKSLPELTEEIDEYLRDFKNPMSFDDSTVRGKLREYTAQGIILKEKVGHKVYYSRSPDTDISQINDIIDFFSETAPCGVIGSFLADKADSHNNVFSFKHHYITGAVDSDVLAQLFEAIHEKRAITVDNLGRHTNKPTAIHLVPLKIYISAQNGRQYLIAYHEKANRLNSYRLDYLSSIRMLDVCPRFDRLRAALEHREKYMWGVSCKWDLKYLEHVEFDILVNDDEQYIVRRLEREKRCGFVKMLDKHTYRYSADVFDTTELIPWIRTYICRITATRFSNKAAEDQFRKDLREMYRIYGIDGGGAGDFQ